MPYAYAGKLLRLDLSSSEWRVEDIEDTLVEEHLLGGGLAAKIYRTGILMYGKKTSYKEIAKWIRHS